MFAHPYTAPQPGAGRRDRRPLVILGLILALAVGLRLGAADGRWLWLDSFRYVQAAQALNEAGMGPYLAQIDSPHADRLAIVLPLAAAIRLLGLSELALIGLPLLLAAGTVVAAFALGRLVSPATGLITALLTAGLPLDVGYSLPILPDSFLPFYGAMALLCFLLGLRRRSWWLYLLSGFFVFCAYESRATGALLLAPFMALAFLWPRRHWPAAIVPLLAFLGLLAAAAAAAWWATGDPLAQFRWNAAVATAPEWAGTGRPLEHLKNMLAPGAWLSHDFAWFYYLAFAAALVAAFRLRRRPKAYLPPLLAFATLYLYFEFGSTSLTAYLPIWKYERFLTPLTVPAALLIGVAATDLFAHGRRPARLALAAGLAAQVLAGLLIAASLGPTLRQADRITNGVVERVSGRLGAYAPERVWAPGRPWAMRLQVYSWLAGRAYAVRNLEGVPAGNLRLGDVLIYDPGAFDELASSASLAAAALPPASPGWELLFSDGWDGPAGPEVAVYRRTG